jgi:hypothetical protein
VVLWCLDTGAGGFLAYETNLPKELLDKSVAMIGNYTMDNFAGHFELVNYQLTEVGALASPTS